MKNKLIPNVEWILRGIMLSNGWLLVFRGIIKIKAFVEKIYLTPLSRNCYWQKTFKLQEKLRTVTYVHTHNIYIKVVVLIA